MPKTATVYEVYDPLISKRVYRETWSHEAAMHLLRRESGSAFDERVVDAPAGVVAGERRERTRRVLSEGAARRGSH